ncbi:MAG: protein kinase domain-containing protein, partial [Aeoliella sp.]
MADIQADEKSIFLRAMEISSADQRAAYLQSACGSNVPLRAEIEALLQAHANPQGLLDAPDVETPTLDQPTSEQPGMQIGPYKLLEKIGEGGMGVVYMAEQREPVRRRVALKIIKPGMDTKLVIARFEAERQALAMMEHQNIARVFDAGETESGRPYFVMELVRGVPITEFCDSNCLTPRQRLELFQQVCLAIQHSHQKGIIHRDIKPTNVLVCNYDGKPVPKVIDFGVAKATHQQLTEKTLFTQHGQVVGTLEYMSPEQAGLSQLDIDTRSDIYSLGVLLYELLTGTTPITKEQIRTTVFVEVLRVICEEEPERPSTRLSRPTLGATRLSSDCGIDPKRLGAELRGELDWVIMRTLEKDRTRRYETVNLLVADIGRYLANEPVQACPPSPAYRLRKLARRHQTALSRIAVVLTLVMMATFFLWWNRAATNKVRVEYEKGLAIDNAIRGQLGTALQHTVKADTHGADAVWTHMLTGIVELYKDQGSSESALRELEQALALDPDNIAIKGLLATAYVWNGRWADHERMLAQIKSIEPDSDNIEAHFFLGQALFWSDPERGVKLLRHARTRWNDPPVVRMMLAEGLGHWAWADDDESHAQEGILLANDARDAMPANVAARAVSNWCHLVAANLRNAHDQPFTHHLEATRENVEWLETKPDHLIGHPCRAWYHDLRGTPDDTKTALRLWRRAVVEKKAGGWYVSCYAAEMYRQGRDGSQLALSEIQADPADPDRQVARVFLLMDSDPERNRVEALAICESLENIDVSRHCATALLMMRLRLGDLSRAAKIAQRLAATSAEPNAYEVIGGSLAAEELFERSFDSRRDELNGRLLVA